MRLFWLVIPLAAGCASSSASLKTLDGELADTGLLEEEEEEDFSMWDGATLDVISPESGGFLPWEEEARFEAEITSADGDIMEFEDIQWASDADDVWGPLGGLFMDDKLDVGMHTLTATAHLPNGDRLVYAVGGVRVQSRYAGTYAGTLTINATMDAGQGPLSVGCAGSATLVVNATGEEVEGEAGCILLLQGQTLETYYVLNVQNVDGSLEGSAAVDFWGFQIPMEFAGEASTEGTVTGGFAANIMGYLDLEGLLEADRVSLDTVYP